MKSKEGQFAVEHLFALQDQLKLSVTDIARLFKVQRAEVYRWQSGDMQLTSNQKMLLTKLDGVVHRLKKSNLKNYERFTKVKVQNGESLFDLLVREADVDSCLTLLIQEGRLIELAYEESGISNSKAKPNDNWKSTIFMGGIIGDQEDR